MSLTNFMKFINTMKLILIELNFMIAYVIYIFQKCEIIIFDIILIS
jgi:hypothetical protein